MERELAAILSSLRAALRNQERLTRRIDDVTVSTERRNEVLAEAIRLASAKPDSWGPPEEREANVLASFAELSARLAVLRR